MRLVITSDTHGVHHRVKIPDGDVLIHAGDCTDTGSLNELAAFNQFLEKLDHPSKILVAGNHDLCFEQFPGEAREVFDQGMYLEDSVATLGGLKIYGSPWQPEFLDYAFNLERGRPLAEKWALIPEDTDILVTHGPPKGILDKTSFGPRVGCAQLRERVRQVEPKLHIFGHIHEADGVVERGNTVFVNASFFGNTLPGAVVARIDGDGVEFVNFG